MRKNCDNCKYDAWDYVGAKPCSNCVSKGERTPSFWEASENYSPMTNADRIRAMTDEELEAFLIDVDLDKVGSPFITEWGKWLKQSAEE